MILSRVIQIQLATREKTVCLSDGIDFTIEDGPRIPSPEVPIVEHDNSCQYSLRYDWSTLSELRNASSISDFEQQWVCTGRCGSRGTCQQATFNGTYLPQCICVADSCKRGEELFATFRVTASVNVDLLVDYCDAYTSKISRFLKLDQTQIECGIGFAQPVDGIEDTYDLTW